MYNISASRKVVAGTLAAMGLLLAGLLTGAPNATASWGQCPANAVCVWSGASASGDFSWWPESSTGCHNHTQIQTIRTTWNRTSVYNVRLGGTGWVIGPNVSDPRVYTGDVCWPA